MYTGILPGSHAAPCPDLFHEIKRCRNYFLGDLLCLCSAGSGWPAKAIGLGVVSAVAKWLEEFESWTSSHSTSHDSTPSSPWGMAVLLGQKDGSTLLTSTSFSSRLISAALESSVNLLQEDRCPNLENLSLKKLVSLRQWAVQKGTSGKRKMFLLSLTCPPSLSLSVAVSSSAIPCVQLFPPLAVPSTCSPAEMQRWTVKADFNPGALGTGLGSPSSWHPAEGKRAKRAILSCDPSCIAHIRPRAANPANCSGKILWGCFGLSADKITFSKTFFPLFTWLHLAISPGQ